MGNSFRVKTLASAVGIALAGFAFLPAGSALATTSTASASQSQTRQSYLVTFAEEGLLHYEGGVAGLAATAPASTGTHKLNAHSPAGQAYAAYLESRRADYIAQIQAVTRPDLQATHQYGITHNGIAAELTASEAAAVAQLPGVVSVKVAGVEHLDTYRGPRFIGADTIWDGTNTPTGLGTQGEGIVAGVIDGGANSSHPSFANDPMCGFSAAAPKLTAVDCSSTGSGGVCNGSNPEANPGFGHGVHTSSTVAGNTIDNTVTPAPEILDGMTMSGVAPCAAIHQYKVCQTTTCNTSAIVAAINNAIADEVDVINFSISGGTSPWGDNDRRFLDAVNADIFVAASAGNNTIEDPTVIGRVAHRGPWMTTVAASTQDEIVGPSLSASGPGTPPVEATKIPLNPGSTTHDPAPDWTDKPIKSYPANIEGCTDSGGIAPGTFTGSIAVIRRGTCSFTEKITNAYNAGAELVVIANNTFGSIGMDTTGAPNVPAYGIQQVPGDALLAFIDDNPSSTTADVSRIALANTQGDVIADFSYRGPTPGQLSDLTKPDITGPGVDIYAATDPASGQYEFMSGTSMSGPHIAGSGALLRAVHPDWTPIEVKSALMTTAKPDGFMEDGTTPWDIDVVGSGRVDLNKAALVGFTMDETYENFLAANPSGGSINVKDLNLPALRNLSCSPDCTFERTVTNRLDTEATWTTSFAAVDGAPIQVTVSPDTFTLQPEASQTLTITVGPQPGTDLDYIAFGYLNFTETSDQAPDQHFTVAISGEADGEPLPDDIIFRDGFDAGAFYEDFDSYTAGTNIAGQGGWKGWGQDDSAGATVVDSISGRSAPNSIEIEGDSDLIHEFDYNSGSWTVTISQYIPSSFSGETYYIFENVYDDFDINIVSWSTQLSFDSASGMLRNESGAANPFSTPIIYDRWVELKLVIDLDNDLQTFYYDGQQMYSGSWTNQFPDQNVPGSLHMGSIDLFANGASPVYYDDLSITKTSP